MAQNRLRVAAASDVVEGKLLGVRVDSKRILLSRIRGQIHAAIDRCPHMGMSLAKGRIDEGVVTCPWHNSRFDLCTGRNMDWASAFLGVPLPGWTHKMLAMGKSPAPLQMLAAEESGGEVYVTI